MITDDRTTRAEDTNVPYFWYQVVLVAALMFLIATMIGVAG